VIPFDRFHHVKEDVQMLVLSRKKGESLVIDGRIRITVSQLGGSAVRLAIEAPREVSILRSELCQVERQASEEPTALQMQVASA
jgi:carbon storage regulator